MAQLPPKVPSMTPNWPDFSHQKMPPSMGGCFAPNGNATAATTSQNPCWVDEFLDFSSVRRGSHRRSVSDSTTFLEAPMQEECRVSAAPPGSHSHSHANNNHEFDRFDDEQFMSMFTTDEISAAAATVGPTGSSSNPSTPSDHNSINDDEKETQGINKQLKNESEEGESQCELQTTSNGRKIDPKRVKRILANRQSAQRSRVRKLQYVSELERSVNSLQAEVSVLSPRVSFLDHQRLLLNVDNSALKQRIAALAQDNIFKDESQFHPNASSNANSLRHILHQQSLLLVLATS
ncbi:unnamed protein product [Malus baccata var. baccata]